MNVKNLTIQNIAKVCHGTLHGEQWLKEENTEAAGVVLDSRLVKENYIFIAAEGEKTDGHRFIPQVFEKGALGVICEKVQEDFQGVCILVEDSFLALKQLAEYYRQQLDIKVIGVTGSVGKTSTKEFIAGVLSSKFKVWKTQGNFNNEIGLPLTVLQLRREHEAAVLEMGISDFGEMHRLSRIAKPDICVLTNIGQCHLEALGDRDGVLKAKSEIFDCMNPEGMIFVNGDDDKLITLKQKWGSRLITFGRNPENDIYAENEISQGLLGSVTDIQGKIHLKEVRIGQPGEHMVLNALAAGAVADFMGLTGEEIREGLKKVQSVSGRSNIISLGELTVIDDCYNANPVSMKAALELLGKTRGRRTAILGDMFELGQEEERYHYEVGEYADERTDVLICVGKLAEYIYRGAAAHRGTEEGLFYFSSKEELYEHWEEIVMPQDILLLKASHGMEFADIVQWLQTRYAAPVQSCPTEAV